MANRTPTKKNLGNLRKKAEKQAHVKHPLPKQQTAAHLEHELNVHVIELEMQNDALMATQAKLNNSCKEYENLFDYSPVGYLTLDNKGVVSRLNKMASEQLGREKSQISGRPFSIFIQDELSQDDFYRHRNSVMESKSLCKMECTIVRGDASILSVLITSIFVVDEANSFKHLLLILNDITELKAQEHKMALALEKERELNELKSRFIRIASHEFRTPLSAILSSNWLIEQYLDAEQVKNVKKHFIRIAASIEDLTTILNDFMSIEKIESGRIYIARKEFNLLEFCKDIIENSSGILGKGQSIEYAHTGMETIKEDGNILKYILLNLLSNACKYSGDNKKIHLRTEVAEDEIVIKVRDEGIGIPLEEQKNLFVVFFRAKNAQNIKGTGLGLHIVKRHTEMLNGTLEFYSQPGIETAFTVRLPNRFNIHMTT